MTKQTITTVETTTAPAEVTTTTIPTLLDQNLSIEVLTSTVTPYKAAVLVNAVLELQNINPVPPQMMYNYTTARIAKGKKAFIPVTDGRIMVQDLQEWVTKYIAKKVLTAIAPVTTK